MSNERKIRKLLNAIQESTGCADHACMFHKLKGMGTNGGRCRCFDRFSVQKTMVDLVRETDILLKGRGY